MKSASEPALAIAARLALGIALGTTTAMTLRGAEASAAKGILDATGVKGGLIVHLGCDDGKLTAALRAGDGWLVHGLDPDSGNITKAREHIRSLGLYGKVTAEQWRGNRLPYTDNLVNLLVTEDLGAVPMTEVMRVLVPNGTAYIKKGEDWAKTVKPWPDNIDEWTHSMHDAGGNAVAKDSVVGPPHHLQWLGAPLFARHHSRLGTVSSVVSAGGRIFSIVDEGSTASVALPAKWALVAQDAFNGIVLWKQPIPFWRTTRWVFRQGPPELSRRLVAVGQEVYVTLSYGAPVSALDAATGKVLRTYEGTEATLEIVYYDGTLVLAVGDPAVQEETASVGWRGLESPFPKDSKRVLAVKADTGKLLWQKKDADTAGLLPMALAVARGRAFFQNGKELVCLDAGNGRELWRAARPSPTTRAPWSAPTLVAYDDVVLSADRAADQPYPPPAEWSSDKTYHALHGWHGKLLAFSAKTGKELWSCPCGETFHAPVDVFVANGLVWVGETMARTGKVMVDGKFQHKGADFTSGRDLHTGEIKKQIMPTKAFNVPVHHRCYRNKATDRYILLGRLGVGFIDINSGEVFRNYWVRGVCQYGIMPANGLLYAPPHACSCFLHCKLNGFLALAPKRVGQNSLPRSERLVRGEAYGEAASAEPQATPADWPTYRHDPSRSGRTPSAVLTDLRRVWQADLPGKLSAPVIAEGKVFVASVDTHAVHALGANDGKPLWHYTTGGRVDSPPTIFRGLAIFGSADGSVTCVRAADGKLVWRFRAAPEERRVMCLGQLESAWPVHGSVLVQDGVVTFAAGRSSYLDGGIRLCRLEASTGKLLSETPIDTRDPQTGGQPDVEHHPEAPRDDLPGAIAGILSGDDAYVYMRHMTFDRQGTPQAEPGLHLYSPTGFLDDSWWHRTYWLYGDGYYRGSFRGAALAAAGRILVFDDTSVYGFGRAPGKITGSLPVACRLFSASKEPRAVDRKSQIPPPAGWSKPVPLLAWAMVLADKTLFIAGPAAPNDGRKNIQPSIQTLEASFSGKTDALLWIVSTSDGNRLAEIKLDALPVFDGMASAGGRLYLTLRNGQVVCMGK